MWLDNRYPRVSGLMSTDTVGRLAKYENQRQWQDVFSRNVALAINLIEWEGLPETCDAYFMEEMLLFTGKCCILYDPDWQAYLSLPCTIAAGQNIYYDHSYYKAYSLNYEKVFMAITHWNATLFDKFAQFSGGDTSPIKGVVFKDNYLEYPMIETIEMYTTKMVDAMRTIDVIAKQLKLPSIIETDEESKLAIQKAIGMIDENYLAIYANKSIAKALKESKVMLTGVQGQTLEAAWNHYNSLQAQYLTALGINNLNTSDKKERLLVDEVNSNNDSIQLNIAYRLDMRMHAAENYKAAFGQEISCKLRHDYEEAAMDSIMQNGGEGGGNSNYDDARGKQGSERQTV